MTNFRVLISIFTLCTLCSPALADEGTTSTKAQTAPASKTTPESPSGNAGLPTSPAATTSEPSAAAKMTTAPAATPIPTAATRVVPSTTPNIIPSTAGTTTVHSANMDKFAAIKTEVASAEKKLSDTRNAQVRVARRMWTLIGPKISQMVQLIQLVDRRTPGHPNASSIRTTLGMLYFSAGMYDDARAQYESSVSAFDSYLSSNNPAHISQKELNAIVTLRAMTRANLATIYVWQHRYSDAGKQLDIAMPTLTAEARTNQERAAIMSTSYTNMAIIAGKTGGYDKASQYLAQSKHWKQVLDKDRPAVQAYNKRHSDAMKYRMTRHAQ